MAADLPSILRALLNPSGAFVEPTVWDVGQLCEVRGADSEWHTGKIYENIVNGDHQPAWKINTRSNVEIVARSGELRAHTLAQFRNCEWKIKTSKPSRPI
eukprot:COSAG02_NODE_1269_length_13533_cov_7.935016_7_plen_100_part_00